MQISAFIPHAFLAAVPAAMLAGGSPWLIVPAIPLVFVALDAACGKATGSDAPAPAGRLADLPLWLFVPAQIALIAWCVGYSARLPVLDVVGLGTACGIVLGIFGMLAAHELIHSRHPIERWLGAAALATLFYAHFRRAHIQGHHRHAGTEEDPTLTRRGESGYRFALRSAARQFDFAIRIGDRSAPRAVAAYLAGAAAMLGIAALAGGWRAALCWLVMAAVAIFILELFNYVVHYGLTRRMRDGTIEPFGRVHAWNVAHRFSNWALLNGGRHSDHHRAPLEPYTRLRHDAAAPTLPFGFGVIMCLALVPPLWRRVMDPRADYWMARD